jgi:hypothetical protein
MRGSRQSKNGARPAVITDRSPGNFFCDASKGAYGRPSLLCASPMYRMQ